MILLSIDISSMAKVEPLIVALKVWRRFWETISLLSFIVFGIFFGPDFLDLDFRLPYK